MKRTPSLLLTAALVCCAWTGCRGEPPPYVHTLYVESLDTHVAGKARLRVRLVQADGRPAPAPDSRSVRPVARGRVIADSLAWRAVKPDEVSVVMVPDPGLSDAAKRAEATIAAALEGRAGSMVRLPPSAQPVPPPRALPGGARAVAPVAELAKAFALLAERPSGGRRLVIVSTRGGPVGRMWTHQSALALSVGADLVVLAFSPKGRGTPRPRAVHPLFVFPIDPAADLTPMVDAVTELVSGGMWAVFDTALSPVELSADLALRAGLPRGGWEEFSLAPLEIPALQVVVDRVRAAAPGRCEVDVRVLDASGRPRLTSPGEVAYELGGSPQPAGAVDQADRPGSVLVVVGARVGDAPATRALVDAALAGFEGTDLARVDDDGDSPAAASGFLPIQSLRPDLAALSLPSAKGRGDLYARLDELERRWGADMEAAPGGATLVVLSTLQAVRGVETVGRSSPRFHATLDRWRARGVVPVWAVLSPAAELRRFPAVLSRLGAVGVSARDAAALRSRLTEAIQGRRTRRVTASPCPQGPEAFAGALVVRAARGGRTATGR